MSTVLLALGSVWVVWKVARPFFESTFAYPSLSITHTRERRGVAMFANAHYVVDDTIVGSGRYIYVLVVTDQCQPPWAHPCTCS